MTDQSRSFKIRLQNQMPPVFLLMPFSSGPWFENYVTILVRKGEISLYEFNIPSLFPSEVA